MSEPTAPTQSPRCPSPVQVLERLWHEGQQPDPFAFLEASAPCSLADIVAVLSLDQWQRWHAGQRVAAEEYLRRCPALESDPDKALELVHGEFLLREELNERPTAEEYLRRFPRYQVQLKEQFRIHEALGQYASSASAATLTSFPPRNAANRTLGAGPPSPPPRGSFPTIPGYQVLGELGRGGMGVVYKARQVTLDRLVALKMIRAGSGAEPAELARFRTEAEAVARLQHPNIVQIYEVGEVDGRPFFSLELVAGGSLAEQIKNAPLAPAQAARLLETLARAMDSAHRAGIIHRDLKPANILLAFPSPPRPPSPTEGGGGKKNVSPLPLVGEGPGVGGLIPKITDFGLAKRLDIDIGQTQTGMVLGTPSYMSPEQAQGKTHEIGPAADVYALGAVLYDVLTGRPPFMGSTPMNTLFQVLGEEPVPPSRLQPRLPRDLETICLKCLEKDPVRRYPDALALAEDLERFWRGEPIRARPVSVPERCWKWARRRPALAALVGVVMLAVVALLGGGVWFTLQLDEARREAEAHADREENQKNEALRLRKVADERAEKLKGALGKVQQAEQEAREEARRLAVTTLQAADGAWDTGRVDEARQWLDQIPVDLRGWEWRYLSRRFQGSYCTLYGHANTVQSVCVSPDGRHLASGGWDNTVRLWDAHTGQLLHTLRGHTHWVMSVCFSPDGRRLASGGWDNTVRLWDARTGQPRGILRGHAGWVNRVCFSPDGQQVASASHDQTLRLWDIRTAQLLHTLRGHTGVVGSVDFSPDGRKLVSSSADETVRWWDVPTGQLLRTLRGYPGVSSVCFSPDGLLLAVSLYETVRLWDARTGQPLRTLRGHSGSVNGMAFSPDGERLVSGGGDQTVRLWDVRTGQPLRTLRGHAGPVSNVTFSPDGQRVASGGEDKTVRLWDVHPGQSRSALRGHLSDFSKLALSPNGRHLASGSADNSVRLWDTRTRQPLRTLHGHTGYVASVCFSPEGRCLASGSGDQTVRLWDTRTGQPLRTLRGHTGPVNSVCFNSDGERLVSGSDDQTVRQWNARTGRLLRTLRGHTSRVSSVAFSPDGRQLASGSEDNTVQVWDAHTGQRLHTLRRGTYQTSSVAFSPDSRHLASGGGDGTVRLWDARTGQPLRTLRGHAGQVTSVCFSPDGQRLASGSADNTVRLWEPRTGQMLLSLRGHASWITSVCFSGDGQCLASGSQDAVRLWEARTGQPLRTLRGHAGPVTGVAFSPDGQRLASSGWDQTVRLWDVHTGQPLGTLRGHTSWVVSVCFSPDGRRLASGCLSGTVRLWDAHAGQRLRTLRGHTAPVASVCFSPDGQRLASGGGDGTVRLWDTRTGQPLRTLRGQAGLLVGVAFSANAQHVVSRNEAGTILAWDVKTGKVVEHFPLPLLSYTPSVARNPREPLLALVVGERIEIADVSPPEEWELGYREGMARFDPLWHREQAASRDKEKNWFAAAFHWRLLAMHEPWEGMYWEKLESACARLGHWRPALAVCERLLRQAPDHAPIYFRRARLRARLFHFQGASADRLIGMALAARNPIGWPAFAGKVQAEAEQYAVKQQWPQACRLFRQAALWERQEAWHQQRLAWALLAAGKEAAFRSTCRFLFDHYRSTRDVAQTYRLAFRLGFSLNAGPWFGRVSGESAASTILTRLQATRNEAIVRTACITANHGLPAKALVHLASQAGQVERSWSRLETLGAAQYRAGQFAEAVKTLEEAVKRQGQGGTTWMKLFLAMASHQQGQRTKAQQWFGKARAATGWHERLICGQLGAEAARLLGVPIR